jgi:hypothetical protein
MLYSIGVVGMRDCVSSKLVVYRKKILERSIDRGC